MGNTKRLTGEEFIEKAKKIYGDKYDYSKVEYINNKTKVCIICPEHGEFKIRPDCHIHQKQGCPKCGNKNKGDSKRLTTEEFIERAKVVHDNKYDYSKVEYKTTDTPVCIICPEHGEFWQSPHNHIGQKQGCPKCSKHYMDNKYFIERAKEIHGDKYDYSKVEYKDSHTNVCIICPKHGEFYIRPNDHLFGHGCGKCYNSKIEDEVEEFLKSNNFVYETQKTFDGLKSKKKLRYDFYLTNEKILIECQGEQHYFPVKRSSSESKKQVLEKFENNQKRDKLKYEYAKKNNIPLIYYTHINADVTTNTAKTLNDLLTKIFENKK